ncbi:MAG: S41 family peptidase [Bacteroidales bacterium]|jgi:carboxyl-terminal processing protease|nr:S41 family peptidase [Bacteroidales bacterium]
MLKIRKKGKRHIFSIIGILIVTALFVGFTKGDDFKIAKSLDIYYSMFRELNIFYVEDTDPEDLITKSIDAMLASLDPYTTYIPESDLDEFEFMTTGQYGGIGALIRKQKDYAIIAQPYKNFPADKAGLKAGDKILEIDGNSTKDMNIKDVSEALKGIPKTEVRIKGERPGMKNNFDKKLIREEIHINSVRYSGLVDKDIAYIKLSKFTKDAAQEVEDALKDLEGNNTINSVILDLRGNPGGLLIEAVQLANIFIDKDKEIVSTKGKISKWNHKYLTTKSAVDKEIPMVVLVNSGSASASEIVAGAMQDLDRAVILGKRTYGKGLVQTSRDLSYNTKLKVTTAKYYIPSGRCIQALDYSNRNEDGSVGHIPDSLISEFFTSNGRKVYDGGGIKPDIEVKQETISKLAFSLFLKNLFFDYATQYAIENPKIADVDIFELSDDDYENFIEFLKDKDFDYETQSEKKLDDLIKIAKLEKYYSFAKNSLDSLKIQLSHDKYKDLMSFKEEIIQILEEEIVGRYYYTAGMVSTTLERDKQFSKAVEILNNKKIYNKLLMPDTIK